MNNSPILFFDSGIGGLPYLEWLKVRMPEESFIYIADNKNFPYGTKSREQLIDIIHDTMDEAVDKYSPKASVIACNTASVISLDHLRSNFDFPFIGVVPAIKPAAFLSENKKIGLMATNRTIEDKYTEKLIIEHASDCEVFRYAGTEIIDFIENELSSAKSGERETVIDPAVKFFHEKEVDIVVLGCTHFLLLENELQNALGPQIKIIDSREGVGRQIVRVLKDKDILSAKKQSDLFVLTGQGDEEKKIKNYRWISKKYGLCAV
ncbi:MAG TPA: glutamate racemase [Spirochaeta sp.]|nr:glutamate racemase [Spirochaeta sp.]